ncbi:protein NLP2-like [Salvia miltiorrhiza]|uniref:protein NLP2-like n=1 Tax=Salvia miltiorrhiza TaxID=226208 RepID=UPI0025ACC73B|nr:protein NLP2-like [Salvia miltiorrhiza]
MADGALSPNISDSAIDFDLIHELFLDGFWLEANSYQQQHHRQPQQQQEYFSKPIFFPHPTMDESLSSHGNCVKQRLAQAINFLKESMRDEDVLVQIWIPVKKQGRQVLTASNQPFSLHPSCKDLASYRDACLSYHLVADDDDDELVGLLGRVFLRRLPEWTPDVRFFRREEYPRVGHAQKCNVRASLALPLLEHGGGGACLGVLELVSTHRKLDFHPELHNVCKALEAVDLKSSNIVSSYNVEERDGSYRGALAEIRGAMRFACSAYKLPLAQVWASCLHQGRGGCRHSDENYARCVSTIDSACCVADARARGFHEACSQHHLLRGEGVPGKAFLTNQPCFAEDITAFSKTEYPLSHHARVFDLCASAAIRLRSVCNEATDFVLEFFLPPDCRGARDQMLMLHSLSSVIQEMCQSLRVITDEELLQETSAAKLDEGGSVPLEIQQDSGPRTSNESLSFGNHSKKRERKHKRSEKAISLEVLRQHFAGSLKEAAKSIGVCPTTLKRVCRRHGITRWPSRKIKKVGHSLRKLQLVIDSVQDGEGPIQLSSFYNNFPHLVSPNVAGASNPSSASKASTGDFEQGKSPAEGNLLPDATTSSSSGSHTSSSSYCCSTGVKQSSFPVNGSSRVDALPNGGVLKKARSDAELHGKGKEKTKPMIRSYSHRLLSEGPAAVGASPVPMNGNRANHEGAFRARVAFGEEKIRLSLQPHWDFKHLREEIFARFSIDNVAGVSLKYLDDDAEWVLLTCDDDLEECRDIHRSSKSPTIKLSVNHPNLGSSFGSDGVY